MDAAAGHAPGHDADPGLYRWDILVPAHRVIFAVEDGAVVEFDRPGDTPADRFSRYQALKPEHPVHGMVAWPNTVLLRGPLTVLVDPGLIVQGPPLILALARLGIDPSDVDLVVNTHHHVDHAHANAYFPDTTVAIHRLELERYPGGLSLGFEPPRLQLLDGDEGDLGPGLRFVRTPGHTEGSICLVVTVAEGRLVIAGDTVGPLPQYFLEMELPLGFPGRADLLRSWSLIRGLEPDVLIPGHNPPLFGI
jgi:glyoxylase-like metal-dependent hydrolase (beta-lactamase superfamily II)